MSNSQQPSNIIKILNNYDIVIYDVDNVNPNKKLLVLDSNKGKVLLQKYNGTSKQLWLAYNVFKTLKGNDVLKISNWYTTSDGAPFLESNNNLYYLTKYNDSRPTADVSLNDHMSFLAKWHYLSREIVYARDFADSLTTPTAIDIQLKDVQVSETAQKLKNIIVNNIKQLNLYNYPEKKLTITLPNFNIKRIVKEEEECKFQPWQQVFKWNWQIVDVANLLCFFKFDKVENIKEALIKYNQLNPFSEAEWRALPSLMLWNLCTEVNYDIVSDSYFDVYETLCTIVSERGIEIKDKIVLPLQETPVAEVEQDEPTLNYPDITNESVNIVVVEPPTENYDTDKIVQFSQVRAAEKQAEPEQPAAPEPEVKPEPEVIEPAPEQKQPEPEPEQKKVELKTLTWKPFPKPVKE